MSGPTAQAYAVSSPNRATRLSPAPRGASDLWTERALDAGRETLAWKATDQSIAFAIFPNSSRCRSAICQGALERNPEQNGSVSRPISAVGSKRIQLTLFAAWAISQRGPLLRPLSNVAIREQIWWCHRCGLQRHDNLHGFTAVNAVRRVIGSNV